MNNSQFIILGVILLVIIIVVVVIIVLKKKNKEHYKLSNTSRIGTETTGADCSGSPCVNGDCIEGNCVCKPCWTSSILAEQETCDTPYYCFPGSVCKPDDKGQNSCDIVNPQGITDIQAWQTFATNLANTIFPQLMMALQTYITKETKNLVNTAETEGKSLIKRGQDVAKKAVKSISSGVKTGIRKGQKVVSRLGKKISSKVKTTSAAGIKKLASFAKAVEKGIRSTGKSLSKGASRLVSRLRPKMRTPRIGGKKLSFIQEDNFEEGIEEDISIPNFNASMADIVSAGSNDTAVPYLLDIRISDFYVAALSQYKSNFDILQDITESYNRQISYSNPRQFLINTFINYITPILLKNDYSPYALIFPSSSILTKLSPSNQDFNGQVIYGIVNDEVKKLTPEDVAYLDVEVGFSTYLDTDFNWHYDKQVEDLCTIIRNSIRVGEEKISEYITGSSKGYLYVPPGGLKTSNGEKILNAGVFELTTNEIEAIKKHVCVILTENDMEITNLVLQNLHMSAVQAYNVTDLNSLPNAFTCSVMSGGTVVLESSTEIRPLRPEEGTGFDVIATKTACYQFNTGYIVYAVDSSNNIWRILDDPLTWEKVVDESQIDPNLTIFNIKVQKGNNAPNDDLIYIYTTNGEVDGTGYQVLIPSNLQKLQKNNPFNYLISSNTISSETGLLGIQPIRFNIDSTIYTKVYTIFISNLQVYQDTLDEKGNIVTTDPLVRFNDGLSVVSYFGMFKPASKKIYVYEILSDSSLCQIEIDPTQTGTDIGKCTIFKPPKFFSKNYNMEEICYYIKAFDDPNGIKLFLIGITGLLWSTVINPTQLTNGDNPSWNWIFDPNGGDIRDIAYTDNELFLFTEPNKITGIGSSDVIKYENADCSIKVNGQCVECTSNDQCTSKGSGFICACNNDDDPNCTFHQCIQCSSSCDCDIQHPYCDLKEFKCLQCYTNNDCINPETPNCNENGECVA